MIYHSTNMRPFNQKVLQGEYSHEKLLALAPKVRLILDIGACDGAFSEWALLTFPKASLIAYEPRLTSAEVWLKNMATVHVNAGRASLVTAAVTSNNPSYSPVSMAMGIHNAGEASIKNRWGGSQFINVATLPVYDLPMADLVKVDTEGCEVEILRNYLGLSSRPLAVLYEWHSEEDRELLDSTLHEFGYALAQETKHSPVTGVAIWTR